MRPDAGEAATAVSIRPKISSSTAVAIRAAQSSTLQAGALGQSHRARHVDEQIRPGHDLPATGSPAAGPTDASTSRKTTSPLSILEAMPAVDTANIASSRPTAASATPTRSSTSRIWE